MKHIFQGKICILLTVVILSSVSCSKNIDEPEMDNKVNEDIEPIEKNENVSTGLNYSSFEVNLPENLRSLTDGAYAIYAVKPSIRFSVNEDGNLDTYWEGELAPTADGHRHLSRISLTSKSIVSEIPFPQGLNLGNSTFLGYEYFGNNRYMMGASEANTDDIQRKRPVYYCFDGSGNVKYSIDLWQAPPDPSDTHAAGRSGQGIIVYNKKLDNFGIYLARRGMGEHQAGWLSFHEAATGKQTFVRPWYISHNFDQRLLPLNDGRYLASAHADELPSRGLLIEAWKFNDDPFNRTWSNVFPIPASASGNYNITNTSTGDLLELPNGNIAVLYTTQHEFTANDLRRDVRLSIFSNVGSGKGSAVKVKDVWLTSYKATETAGWGAQMAHYSQGKIFVAWNVFDMSNTSKVLKSSLAIVDYDANVLTTKDVSLPNGKNDNSRLVQSSQIIRKTNDGKYLVFMSEGSAPNKLRVNLVAIN